VYPSYLQHSYQVNIFKHSLLKQSARVITILISALKLSYMIKLITIK